MSASHENTSENTATAIAPARKIVNRSPLRDMRDACRSLRSNARNMRTRTAENQEREASRIEGGKPAGAGCDQNTVKH
ncbi:hypothetical protein GCM10009079_39290 [Ralstonia mannitolilytica]